MEWVPDLQRAHRIHEKTVARHVGEPTAPQDGSDPNLHRAGFPSHGVAFGLDTSPVELGRALPCQNARA